MTGSPSCLTMLQYLPMMTETLATRVSVIMSEAAGRFVPAETVSLLTGGPVFTSLHQQTAGVRIPHIELTERASLMLVMPATANILGKAASGICDDLVSSSIVACPAPVVFVPSMNHIMWHSGVVGRNVATLRQLGHTVIEPWVGTALADDSRGIGVMPPLESFLDDLVRIARGLSHREGPATGPVSDDPTSGALVEGLAS